MVELNKFFQNLVWPTPPVTRPVFKTVICRASPEFPKPQGSEYSGPAKLPQEISTEMSAAASAPPASPGIVSEMLQALRAVDSPCMAASNLFGKLMEAEEPKVLALGGHRGMGENLWDDAHPLALPSLWRENTVKSFLKAAQHGVTFIEFDVQITKDGVPVLWHDDSISFGSPIHPIKKKIRELTAEEFKSIGPRCLGNSGQVRELISVFREFRSKKTKQKLNINNMWRCFDDDELPTLEDVFRKVPESVAFNVEVKMDTPEELVHTPREEVEFVTEAILRTVDACQAQRPISPTPSGVSTDSTSPDYDDLSSDASTCSEDGVGTRRTVVLSSFDPEVVVELQKRQNRYPVMFLSDGGLEYHADPRRSSLMAAVDWACEHRLKGVCFDSTALRSSKGVVMLARGRGLRVMTYGLENDDANWLKEQVELGVHAAIVDDVAGVIPKFSEDKAV